MCVCVCVCCYLYFCIVAVNIWWIVFVYTYRAFIHQISKRPTKLSSTMITKSSSCNEIWTQRSQEANAHSKLNGNHAPDTTSATKKHKSSDKLHADITENHKTVIYFGDSLSNRRQQLNKSHRPNGASPTNDGDQFDVKHANRLCDEMIFQHQKPSNRDDLTRSSRRSERSTLLLSASMSSNGRRPPKEIDFPHVSSSAVGGKGGKGRNREPLPTPTVPPTPPPPPLNLAPSRNGEPSIQRTSDESNSSELRSDEKLPSFIESIVDGVISIKIDSSYDVASKLLHSIENGKTYDKIENNFNDMFSDVDAESNNAYLDWSFVQDWRTR